jgi:hypothetical protein
VDEEQKRISRRDLVKKGAVGVGLVWATPMIQTWNSPAYGLAGSPPPGPIACSTPTFICENVLAGCACARTTEGDAVCVGPYVPVLCRHPPFQDCPPGYFCLGPTDNGTCVLFCDASSDCPPGSVCITDTCITGGGLPICFPLATPANCVGGCN